MVRFFDPAGVLIPPGRLCKTWTTDLDGGVLPGWLTLRANGSTDAGSSSGASATDPGGVALTTAASAGSTVALIGTEIDLTNVDAVQITATFTGGTDEDPDVGMRLGFIGASNRGGWGRMSIGAGSGAWFLQVNTATGSNQYKLAYATQSPTTRYQLSILLTCVDGALYLMDGEAEWGQRVFGAAMLLGAVNPVIEWTDTDGVGITRDVHQLTVERWWH